MNKDNKPGDNKQDYAETAKKVAKTTAKAAAKTAKVSGHIVWGLTSAAMKTAGTLVLIAILTGLGFTIFFAMFVKNELNTNLNINITDLAQSQTSIIYYYDNSLGSWQTLETLYSADAGNVVLVDYEDIPQNLINAAIAIEDHRFKSHHGVDWYRTIGAFYTMFLKSNNTFGGSTITQQLIKNVTEYDEVTIKRKLTEIFSALDLEKRYTKEEIITGYLNIIPLSQMCNGVGSAARVYFGKEVSELSLAECASIIGITNNPSLYDPYINERTRERNKERQELILRQMCKYGFITESERDAAIAETLVFRNTSREAAELAAAEAAAEGSASAKKHYYSWFTDAVIEDVIRDLMSTKNISRKAAELLLYTGGYHIYTTLDTEIQAKVDEIYSDQSNLPDNISKYGERLSSSILIMNPYTGDIVAMAGGVGEKVGNRLENGATDTKRWPGSSIKPISVYAPALDLGYIQPWTLIDDSSTGTLLGHPNWWPRNSDLRNRGVISIADAIRASVNTVACQVLDKLTPQVSYNFLTDKLHITTLIKSDGAGHTDIDYSPLALGQLTYGLTVREAAAAYTIFPNKGMYVQGRTYVRIEDSNGKIVIDNIPESNSAISEVTAYQMVEMMKTVVSGGTGTEARLQNVQGIPLAGKTGTSGGVGDRWFIGYTPYYVAAVWTGYKNSHDSLPNNTNPSARIFSKVMSLVHQELGPREFTEPANMQTTTICMDSGQLATDACIHDIRGDHTMTLKMHKSAIPSRECETHVELEFCVLSVDTLMPDGTVAKAGTITGMKTAFCPDGDIHILSVIDPSKSTYKVPADESAPLPYVLGTNGYCYVHPALAAVPPPAEEPTDSEDNPIGNPDETQPPDDGEPNQPEQPPEASALPMPTVPPDDVDTGGITVEEP